MATGFEEKKIKDAFLKLFEYCEREDYKGYDPYDSLNSRFFNKIPVLSKSALVKLAWTQFFKRSPINLRKYVGIDKEYNPKAVGLFLQAFCLLYRMNPKQEYRDKIVFFSDLLLDLQTPGWSGSCWGYNFDWQSRAFFQPKFTPTVVATTFIGSSILDAYEVTQDKKYLDAIRSSCDFILNDLNRTYDESGDSFSFSYSPLDKSVVYNASLLGSRLLSRVYSFTKEKELIVEARKSVVFACKNQQENGAWSYGRYDFHQWIDNFHTGYNLECISDYSRFTGSDEFLGNLSKGFDYYLNTFFTEAGVPKYYNNSVYPIDIHAPTQLIITLHKLGKFQEHRKLAEKVLGWTIDHMQSPEGYFYYQINRFFTSKISYMRWSQAWMFLALIIYEFENLKSKG
ncbi:delta-aminolevulinic acid dehydratase [Lunatimonas salinarum]|uniref:delta-aminolevulinic acid dehydratase n=1 Tax=Lunatimonas salinarum TaxID=1774590 RepID=UPI001ADFDF2F|nr:delta-aminolevulinic acid dehydratase [Lunatimonas salinarum]